MQSKTAPSLLLALAVALVALFFTGEVDGQTQVDLSEDCNSLGWPMMQFVYVYSLFCFCSPPFFFLVVISVIMIGVFPCFSVRVASQSTRHDSSAVQIGVVHVHHELWSVWMEKMSQVFITQIR